MKESDILSNCQLLKTVNLTKRFGGVVASNAVNIEIGKCEIHAIIGENGAGKSTFCKMITGQYRPDDGDIYFCGKKVNFSNTQDSMKTGIGMVYQERNLVGYLTGAQNITLGHEPKKFFMVDEKACLKQSNEIRKKLNVSTPIDVPVETLGAGSQQLIEIMQAFYSNPKLLILDEPTASLGAGEVEPFLEFVREIKNQMKISIIFISHKLDEVFAIADKISVFTEGKCLMTVKTGETTQDECIKMMLRSDKVKQIQMEEKSFANAKIIFSMDKITFDNRERTINLCVHKGEVVGLYGLVGSGRTETMESVCGIREAEKVSFIFDGETISNVNPQRMIKKGMALTPEIRRNGIFPALSLTDNICNLFLKQLSTRVGFLKSEKMKELTFDVLRGNEVKYSNISQSIAELSGGNIQKIIIGRTIKIKNLKMLIVDEPTAGMDLGAKSEICLKIRNLADEVGMSFVFISSELDELMATCDSIYIFRDGNVVGSFERKAFDKNSIMDAVIRGGRNGD